MKRPLLITALLIVVTATSMPGQTVPGYLGKRLGIEYQLYFFPAIFNPTHAEQVPLTNDYDTRHPSLGMSFQHHIIGEYTLSKKYALALDVNFLKTYYDPYWGYYYYDSNNDNAPIKPFKPMHAVGFMVSLKNYKKHFAPLGYFSEFKLGYTIVSENGLTASEALIDSTNTSLYEGIDGGSKGAFQLGLGWGINRIYFDKIITTFGFELNFCFSGYGNGRSVFNYDSSPNKDVNFSDGNTQENQDALLSIAVGRFSMQSLMNFRIGIGILP